MTFWFSIKIKRHFIDIATKYSYSVYTNLNYTPIILKPLNKIPAHLSIVYFYKRNINSCEFQNTLFYTIM